MSSSTGPCQERLCLAEWDSTLDAKEQVLQTLHGLASETLTLRAKASQLRGSVETLGSE